MTQTDEKKTGKSLTERFELLDRSTEEEEQIREAFRKGDLSVIETLDDWVYLWIREILPNAVKERTRLMYGETMERHILPHIGTLKLSDLTAERINRWINTLKMQKMPCTMEGKMKEGTVRNTLSILSGCLRDAQKRGLIKENPCIEVAEVMTSRNVYEEKEWLTSEEIVGLQPEFSAYRAENDYPIGIAYELILYTGISLSEVLTLQWKDVCEDARTLQIRSVLVLRNTTRADSGFFEVEELRGHRKRNVPVPEKLMEKLRKIRIQYQRTGEEYVVSEMGDSLLRQDRFRTYLMRCSKRKLKRNVTPRMLRDTYAIYALKAGADSDTVAGLLGFSSSKQIIRRYMPEKVMNQQQIVESVYEECNKENKDYA